MPYMPCPWVIIIENKEEKGSNAFQTYLKNASSLFPLPPSNQPASKLSWGSGAGLEEGKGEGAPREILPAGYQATTLFFNPLKPKYLHTNSPDQSPRMDFSL